jgi:uncharacterized membrane protein YbhN (UPF0104 family)
VAGASEPSESDIHLLFQTAHDDLWSSRGQQWNASNWALVLDTAIAGVAALVYKSDGSNLSSTWPLVILASAVYLAAAGYIARLHYDIVRRRREIDYLKERRPQLKQLAEALPTASKEPTNATRGLLFTTAQVIILAGALWIVVYLLSAQVGVSVAIAVPGLLVGGGFLWCAATCGAA